MGRIILLRHGRTLANAAHILDTRPPGAELSVIGRQQAHAAGQELADLGINLGGILCSVALRAQQTAVAVAQSYTQARGLDLTVEVTPGIHEIFAGDYEASASEEAHEQYLKALYGWMHRQPDTAMPGGESATQVLERFQPVLDTLASRIMETDQDYLVVTHGAAMRIAGYYSSDVPDEVVRTVYMQNCGMIILEPQDYFGTWHCLQWANEKLG
ncbi:phosphoglycerate mutase [Corynebacterium kutscheri]|uniref:Fructose-2,6-bisphosphatase n=1 Tax=Corynebacterium kutscheri TaxID=35755 RepID=A0A0F6TEW0_9CORY|nr:histidine phosphatase family protein [Corynebacterium kutscheri]AKE42149.1 fructose-2,6-bisphosphatase [Corynebacterium kutscheri]VEH05881.1 phosphoglycerate mutase [Corynebacterium kutscheri]VEH10492.1 phosphoglycerate mutase [Corynebacterium kutscheri]VEH81772.1 phosphoglycerate mutase [Corynebacterium kutscheri]